MKQTKSTSQDRNTSTSAFQPGTAYTQVIVNMQAYLTPRFMVQATPAMSTSRISIQPLMSK